MLYAHICQQPDVCVYFGIHMQAYVHIQTDKSMHKIEYQSYYFGLFHTVEGGLRDRVRVGEACFTCVSPSRYRFLHSGTAKY